MDHVALKDTICSISQTPQQSPPDFRCPVSAQSLRPSRSTSLSQAPNIAISPNDNPAISKVWQGRITYPLQQQLDQEPAPLDFPVIVTGGPNQEIEPHRWPNHFVITTGFKPLSPDTATEVYASQITFGQVVIDESNAASDDSQKWQVFCATIVAGWCIFYEFPLDPANPTYNHTQNAHGILFFSSSQAPGQIMCNIFIDQPCPASLVQGGYPAGPRVTGIPNLATSIGQSNPGTAAFSMISPAGGLENLGAEAIINPPSPKAKESNIPPVTPGSGMIPGGGIGIDMQHPSTFFAPRINPAPPPTLSGPVPTDPTSALGSEVVAGVLGLNPDVANPSRVQARALDHRALEQMALVHLGLTPAKLAAATPTRKRLILAQIQQILDHPTLWALRLIPWKVSSIPQIYHLKVSMSHLAPQATTNSTLKVSQQPPSDTQPPLSTQHLTSSPEPEPPGQSPLAHRSASTPDPLDGVPTGLEVWRGEITYLLHPHTNLESQPLSFRAIAVGAPNLNIQTHHWSNCLARTAGFKLLPRDVAAFLYRLEIPFGQMRVDPSHGAEDGQKWRVFQKLILAGWCIFYGFPIDPTGPTHSPVYGAYGILFFSSPQAPDRVLFKAFVSQSCPAPLARDGAPAGPRLTAPNLTTRVSGTVPNTVPQNSAPMTGAVVNLDMTTIWGLLGTGEVGDVMSSTAPTPEVPPEEGAEPSIRSTYLGTNISPAAQSSNPAAVRLTNIPRLGATGTPGSNASTAPAANPTMVNQAQAPAQSQASREQIRTMVRMALFRLGITPAQLAAATPVQKQAILAKVKQVVHRMRILHAKRQTMGATGAAK